MKQYGIVFICNKNNKRYLEFCIYCLNKVKSRIPIYVLSNELFDFQYKNSINFIQINNTECSNTVFENQNRIWKFNPSYRFEMFRTFTNFDKILYLDTDIHIKDNFDELFELDYDFCASELHNLTNKHYAFGDQKGYNAGVLLISKKYLTDQTYNILLHEAKKKIYNGNQKIFNKILFPDYFLNIRYNLTTDFISIENIGLAKIIHFIGEKKPLDGKTVDECFCRYVRNVVGDPLLVKILKDYRDEFNQFSNTINY